MSGFRPQRYRFATWEQWAGCLLHGFDRPLNGALRAAARLGRHALPVTSAVHITQIVVDPYGQAVWRQDGANGGNAIASHRDSCPGHPLEIAGALATSPRWVVDRHWIWAFTPTTVARWERDSLQHDHSIAIAEALPAEALAAIGAVSIHDIAGDGNEGIWLLVGGGEELRWLLHFDCEGRYRGRLPVPREADASTPVGVTKRGSDLVLLAHDGRTLLRLDVHSGTVVGIDMRQLSPGWHATALATDGADRIVVRGERRTDNGPQWVAFVLDGSGDMLDGPFDATFLDPPSGPVASAAVTDEPPAVPLVAVSSDAMWFGLADGVQRLGIGDEYGARASNSTLLTPVLVSPPTGDRRGWLRAEIAMTLPKGAVLEVEYRSTDHRQLAEQAADTGDRNLPTASTIEAVWDLLEPRHDKRMTFAGPTTKDVPIAVPLFDCEDQWLVLRLNVMAPPGVASPVLHELRVLYPDVSLMQYLPAVYRTPEGDQAGALRRLVGVLETTSHGIDEQIGGIGTRLEAETAPKEWLDYLGGWLDLPWDNALHEAVKRKLLTAAGDLLRQRGTRRGLQKLVECLTAGKVSIADVTVDHAPMRLGGGAAPGTALPALLGGAALDTATLGGKAVLGRARLACAGAVADPLHPITPTIRIAVARPRPTPTEEAVLRDVVAQYVPAGVAVSIRWSNRTPSTVLDAAGLVLDGDGPGHLGDDSVLGRTIVMGRRARIAPTGIEVGFQLN